MRRPVGLLVMALLLCGGTTAAQSHDVGFWRAIARDGYAPPPGSDVPTLARELIDLLDSPDPELRDDVAYSTLANWIFRRKILGAAALRPMTERLLANLSWRIGERDTDSVFRRSFSALVLSVVVARDNGDPFLDAAEWHHIEQGALAYLLAEQDVRGYDADKGWMHSAAHTADLLKFLGRGRDLSAAGQARLLAAIGQKLTTVAVVFTHGEDERFARAVLSLVNRQDFDPDAFAAWIARGQASRLAASARGRAEGHAELEESVGQARRHPVRPTPALRGLGVGATNAARGLERTVLAHPRGARHPSDLAAPGAPDTLSRIETHAVVGSIPTPSVLSVACAV